MSMKGGTLIGQFPALSVLLCHRKRRSIEQWTNGMACDWLDHEYLLGRVTRYRTSHEAMKTAHSVVDELLKQLP